MPLADGKYHLTTTYAWFLARCAKRLSRNEVAAVFRTTREHVFAAAKLAVPIAHVEAGLRSFNTRMPEEINRVLTDHVSAWLLCPTRGAVENLRRYPERFHLATVHRAETTGDRTRLQQIFAALQRAALDVPVVLPLHPRTRQALDRSGIAALLVQSAPR